MNKEKTTLELLLEKQNKLAQLLAEYQKVKELETKKYHIFPDKIVNDPQNFTYTIKCSKCQTSKQIEIYHFREYRYYLVEIKTKKVVCYGDKKRLKQFISFKDLPFDDIYFEW